jgi:succinate dehydrogenase / fumarate reductase cytochrome b subunit
MSQRERPLSPFMLGSLYRWQITSVMSFLHRATGVALSAGAFLLVAWLIALMRGPEVYATFAACVGSLLGRLVLAAFVFALVFHLLNGIRHLAWDAGVGFSIPGLYKGGYIVAALTAVITLLVWYFGFAAGGAA